MYHFERRETDLMTPSERLEALLNRQRPDRVPLMPFIFGFCAGIAGYSLADLYEDAEKCFWAQIRTAELIGHDGNPYFAYASQGAWEFGGEIKMPKGEFSQAPTVKRSPITLPEEVDDLQIPSVETAGAYPFNIAVAKIQQQFGMPICMFGFSPFTAAGNVCGVENLCRWMKKNPNAAHALLRKCTDFHKKVVDYFVETFSDQPVWAWMSEATSTNQLISPSQFKEFAFPYVKEAHEYCRERGIRYTFNHICGDQNLNLPLWTEIPFGDPGILSFGHEVDLSSAIEHFGHKHIVAGNIEPTCILFGPWEKIYELSRVALEKAKYAPSGYILMAGCGVAPMTPPYHVYAMKKAIMDFGLYD